MNIQLYLLKLVSKAVWKYIETYLKERMKNKYGKLQNICNDNFGRKEYMSSLQKHRRR